MQDPFMCSLPTTTYKMSNLQLGLKCMETVFRKPYIDRLYIFRIKFVKEMVRYFKIAIFETRLQVETYCALLGPFKAVK